MCVGHCSNRSQSNGGRLLALCIPAPVPHTLVCVCVPCQRGGLWGLSFATESAAKRRNRRERRECPFPLDRVGRPLPGCRAAHSHRPSLKVNWRILPAACRGRLR